MNIEVDFFNKVVTKYIIEFLMTITLLRIITYTIQSKLFIFILYVYHKFKLPFFTNLNSQVTNHVYFNSLYSLKIKPFLRYVLNKEYRDYMKILSDNLIDLLNKHTVSNIIGEMLFSKKRTFLNLLIKSIQALKVEHEDYIRDQAEQKKISIKFAWDYLLYIDFTLQFLISRIKDLENFSQNNYQLYVSYLFVMSDTLNILMDQMPSISRARLKGTSFIIEEEEKEEKENARRNKKKRITPNN